MNSKRKAICLSAAIILLISIGCIAAVCHIASSFNKERYSSSSQNQLFEIKLKGGVKKEGKYLVEENTLIYDCIRMAGGVKNNADLSGIELTKRIDADCTVCIPTLKKGDIKVERQVQFSSDGAYMQCDINRASKSMLIYLNGIGEKTASNIVKYREKNGFFKTKDQILNVKGIGITTYNKIKDCITVGGEQNK